MTDAIRFRRQAAKCATLAKRTRDEESRQRYLWLEQTYLHLAESEDQMGQISAFARDEQIETRSLRTFWRWEIIYKSRSKFPENGISIRHHGQR